MSISTVCNMNVLIKDQSQGLSISHSQSITDGVSPNVVEEVYTLAKSQASFLAVEKGDIDEIKEVFIKVTSRPSTFAGIGIGFGAVDPVTSSFIMTDAFVLQGNIPEKIWVKNLDTVEDCTMTIILVGSNA